MSFLGLELAGTLRRWRADHWQPAGAGLGLLGWLGGLPPSLARRLPARPGPKRLDNGDDVVVLGLAVELGVMGVVLHWRIHGGIRMGERWTRD